jgi:hypothetical protein
MQTSEFFNNGQLLLVASVAHECAAPFDGEKAVSDEMAVYVTLNEYTSGWTVEQLAVIKFCAEQCERQKSGAISVYWLVNALNNAMSSESIGRIISNWLQG